MATLEEKLAKLKAELEIVETSIDNVLKGGEEYRKETFGVRMTSLKELRAYKQDLENKIATIEMCQ